MYAMRTRFKRDIVAEFLPPRRLLNVIKDKKTFIDAKAKIIIFATGMPRQPNNDQLVDFWSKKGYWALTFRYRGSWESGGEFLQISPEQDVLDIVDQLPRGFESAWNKQKFKLNVKKIILIGTSFGGPAAILASRDKRVDRVIAVAPVIDWNAPSKLEKVETFYPLLKSAFGEAYRLPKRNWLKLLNGKFYNLMHYADEIDGSKILIFHARDDEVVNYKAVEKFARKTGAKLQLYKKGGHLSSRLLMKPSYYKKVTKFINS